MTTSQAVALISDDVGARFKSGDEVATPGLAAEWTGAYSDTVRVARFTMKQGR